MQKIIPFKKEVNFKDNVSEITSISLEHSLHREEANEISGEFTVSGEYRVVDTSSVIDKFSFELPFDIHLDEKYDMSKATIDIDDFYYEIINSNVLSVHIDVILDKVEEKVIEEVRAVEEESIIEEPVTRETVVEEPIEELFREEAEPIVEEREETVSLQSKEEEEVLEIREDTIMEDIARPKAEEKLDTVDTISSIFESGMQGGYATYHIYMVREEDTLEGILQKYGVTRESIEKYNDVKEIKMGDKLIIPCMTSEKV